MKEGKLRILATSTEVLPEEEVSVLTDSENKYQIILFNDEFNTFDYVIECLIEVCEHHPEQAEQCTYLVHYKGKCDVKRGALSDLEPRCKELLRRGLTAEIQDTNA
ncbi:MAG: hypothetical protein CL843_10840 [Crocinitomicaceae bacterium]|nr:hypothetical protein [Crocinitomicaceae bacterium]|tara:strand:+ start:275 stop:592 length:318 start_codon:yes stop_codon:yes gene_type:complete